MSDFILSEDQAKGLENELPAGIAGQLRHVAGVIARYQSCENDYCKKRLARVALGNMRLICRRLTT
ncbi:MAG: hypothetical protein DSY80_10715 [Desulfocapsa sp.]|nr:MAG: hypothetical protein DSY80_10715 [Desulfocapsa sp.]